QVDVQALDTREKLIRGFDAQVVRETDGVDEAGQFVKAVVPPAEDFQSQVDFGVTPIEHRNNLTQSSTLSASGRCDGSMPACVKRAMASDLAMPSPSASELASVLR